MTKYYFNKNYIYEIKQVGEYMYTIKNLNRNRYCTHNQTFQGDETKYFTRERVNAIIKAIDLIPLVLKDRETSEYFGI